MGVVVETVWSESLDVANGYIALTDPDWYSFLRAHPRVDEVNFWQPHGGRTFRAVRPGDLFFFKLRAPQKAIAGFGFFERYESLPAWLAWDCFEEMNGASRVSSSFSANTTTCGQVRLMTQTRFFPGSSGSPKPFYRRVSMSRRRSMPK